MLIAHTASNLSTEDLTCCQRSSFTNEGKEQCGVCVYVCHGRTRQDSSIPAAGRSQAVPGRCCTQRLSVVNHFLEVRVIAFTEVPCRRGTGVTAAPAAGQGACSHPGQLHSCHRQLPLELTVIYLFFPSQKHLALPPQEIRSSVSDKGLEQLPASREHSSSSSSPIPALAITLPCSIHIRAVLCQHHPQEHLLQDLSPRILLYKGIATADAKQQ